MSGPNVSGERTLPAKQRSKSMSRVKEEQQARLAAVRQAAAEAQMLGDFIRLADYMTVPNLPSTHCAHE